MKRIKLKNRITSIKFFSEELTTFCAVNEKPDYFDLTIEFSPDKYTLEVGSFREYLYSLRSTFILTEELAGLLSETLYDVLKPHSLYIKLINKTENIEINILTKKE